MIPKFRVWDKNNKKMLNWKGLDLTKELGEDEITIFEPTGQFAQPMYFYETMQSTGLKDNDGIEFYEKDIVRNIDSEELGVVEYDEGQFRVSYNGVSEQLWEIDKDLQIIGNIYEHPELLEG